MKNKVVKVKYYNQNLFGHLMFVGGFNNFESLLKNSKNNF